jgi:hypothetical protein
MIKTFQSRIQASIPYSEIPISIVRSARTILRKPAQPFKKMADPAEAFCQEGLCPQATTQAPRKRQTLSAPRRARGLPK